MSVSVPPEMTRQLGRQARRKGGVDVGLYAGGGVRGSGVE